MAIIPHLIARYALVLYALSGLGAFFYVWTAIQSRRREDLALFTMEREDAGKQSLRAWLMAGVCVLVAVGVYSISNFIAPNLPLDQSDDQPEVGLLITPSVNPEPSATPSTTLALTPTVTFGPISTVAPIATPLDRPPDTPTPPSTLEGNEPPANAACSSAGTQITQPSNGDVVSGVVMVMGTASLPDFAFYKFEIFMPDRDEWVTVQSFDIPVAGGPLGQWDTTLLEPGPYQFRLVVVDSTYNYPDPCVITIVVERPAP